MPTTISSKTQSANAASKQPDFVAPREVVGELEKHLLLDGFKLVFDPAKSRGSKFVDAST